MIGHHLLSSDMQSHSPAWVWRAWAPQPCCSSSWSSSPGGAVAQRSPWAPAMGSPWQASSALGFPSEPGRGGGPLSHLGMEGGRTKDRGAGSPGKLASLEGGRQCAVCLSRLLVLRWYRHWSNLNLKFINPAQHLQLCMTSASPQCICNPTCATRHCICSPEQLLQQNLQPCLHLQPCTTSATLPNICNPALHVQLWTCATLHDDTRSCNRLLSVPTRKVQVLCS